MARSSSTSEKDVAASLARATEALRTAPGDLGALAQVAGLLSAAGKKAETAKAFEVLARAAREDGAVALAIYAARSVGDARGKTLAGAIAAVYGKGSTRIDASLRARPPAPRRAPAEPPTGAPPAAKPVPLAAAVKEAVVAVEAAGARAAEAEAKKAKLPAVPLLSALSPAALEELIGVMKTVARAAGDVVIETGEDAAALFLVARGTLAVSRGAHELGRLRPGAFFGEIALLGGTRRTARVTVEEDAWLLEIPRAALEAAAARAPGLADTLAAYARTRLLGNTMRTSEVFRRLDPEERDRLMTRFEPRVIDAGARILEEGQAGDRLHVVVSGEVEVRRAGAVVATLAAGDVFGEMGLLHRKPASADVVAAGRTVTLSLDRKSFDDVAVKHPELLAEVYKLLIQREAQNSTSPVAGDEEEIIL